MSARTLALAAGSALDQPAMVLIEAAAAAGFGAVGLRLSGEHAVADPAALGAAARAAGVTVHDCEVYRIDASRRDPRPLIDAAAAAGAAHLLAVSDLDDRETTVERLAELVALARPHGVRIGVEYMAWTEPSDPAGAIEVAERTGCVIVVDVLHHTRVGAGPDELDAIVASGRLGWVQLCDAGPGPDPDGLLDEARHGRLTPGTGILPLRALLARVPAAVTISVEVQSDDLLALSPGERARLLHDAATAVLGHSPNSTG